MRNLLFVILSLIVLSSCVKDKPSEQVNSAVNMSSSQKVYVINEGNFTSGNASVSYYDPQSKQVIEDLYNTQNNTALGDVAQSMNVINGKYYVVVNNSGKIMVCDQQFKKIDQINGLTSPRFILPITNQKAYVSDYKSNNIHVIDLNTHLKTASVYCPGWTEQMQLIYNKVFVTNMRRNYVYVINTLSDKIEDSVFVGINAGTICLDKRDKIWVVASGDQVNSSGRLTRINALTNQVEQFFEFVIGASPEKICLNKTKDTLYFMSGHIYRMAINDTGLPGTAFIEKGNKVFYGLGINPFDYTIYAADALDYMQKSNIYVFDAKGSQITNFKAGIISNGFYFED